MNIINYCQGPAGVSLQDAICRILLQYRQSGTPANMPDIIQRLASEFPSLSLGRHTTATVHRALGTLIKERKVYYAGAGYMLVVPDMRLKEALYWPASCCSSSNWSIKLRRDMSSQTEHPVHSQPSLACWQPSQEKETEAVETVRRKTWAKPRQIDTSEIRPESRRSRRTVQRSQSLRLSREARVKIDKGGSLKLSKEDSDKIQDYLDKRDPAISDPAPTKKTLTRRDSIISKFFSRRKSQKEVKCFSAQFPPREKAETEDNIYSEPGGSETERPPPPSYQSAPPYRARTSLSQLHLARTVQLRVVEPPAKRSLKYSSLSSASASSSPSSLSGPSSLDSVTPVRENSVNGSNSPDVESDRHRHNQNNKTNPQARYSLGYSN